MAAGTAVGGGKKGSGFEVAWILNLLTDLAFNLLIFFVVCASAEKDVRGRPQKVPSANKDKAAEPQGQNVEVELTRTAVKVNGDEVPTPKLGARVKELLAAKAKPEDKIVVVKSAKDTPYNVWIRATAQIEQAGGVITLQLEEEKEVRVR